jgi:hypothetical protein
MINHQIRPNGFKSLVYILLLFPCHGIPAQFTLPTISGRQLLDGGNPFRLRSFAYSPTPIGLDIFPDQAGYLVGQIGVK